MTDRADKAVPLKPPSVAMGGLHLAALWALAILQPLLNLLGSNADFFVARDNTGAEITVFVLLLAVLPPLAATLVEALVNLASPRARWLLHLVLAAILFALVALQLLKQFADGPAWPMLALAALLGVLLAWAYASVRFVRAMSDILIIAPPVVLASFFFFSDAAELTTSTSEVQARDVSADRPAPVVMVIFDELPAGSLMTPSGRINQERFPSFSFLQGTSTWYRNTVTDASHTALAAPSIMTGKSARRDSLPTAAHHPDSIFTLLGGDWSTRAIEPITKLCPDEICGTREADRPGMGEALSSLATDLTAVTAHLVLPAEMGDSLPDISQTFEGFGESDPDQTVERGRARQWVSDRLREGGGMLDGESDVDSFIETLGTEGRTFDFIHVEKPHYPWTHYPPGFDYTRGTEDFRRFITETEWRGNPYLTDRARQAHQLEVGFTDRLLGKIIDALRRSGRWQDTLFVATSDHGAAWNKGANRREAEASTMGQIAMVPLFIKAPGQRKSVIVDRPTCTTEIVPEMARILGIELPWQPAGCDRETVRVDNGSGPVASLSFAETIAQRSSFVKGMAELLGGDGTGWDRAFRWGPHSDLIGRPLATLPRSPAGDDPPRAEPAIPAPQVSTFWPRARFNAVLRQRGTVEGLEAGVPLAVAVNGRIAAVGETYLDGDRTTYSILLPWSMLRPGANRISLFEIRTGGRGDAGGETRLSHLWSSADQ